MAAIGKIDVLAVVIRSSQQFLEQAKESDARTSVLPAFGARISDPPAQPHIEQSHQKSQPRVGIRTHIRAGRSARNCNCRSHGHAMLESWELAGEFLGGRVGGVPISLVWKWPCKPSVDGRQSKRTRLSCLQREFLAAHNVQA